MPTVALIRLVSLAAIAALRSSFPSLRGFEQIVLAIACSHYALALWYARGRVATELSNYRSAVVLVLLAATSFIPFALGVSVFVWFGVHHVFNEVYTPKRPDGTLLITGTRRYLALALHGAVFVCLHKTRTLFTTPVFWAFFAAAWALFAAYLVSVAFAWKTFSWRERGEHVLGECMAMAMVVFSFWAPINLLHVAGYHFAFWMLYPAVKMSARQRGEYVIVSAVAMTAAIWITLRVLDRTTMVAAFTLLTFFHVQVSLGLSAINPEWLTGWFRSLRRTNAKFA